MWVWWQLEVKAMEIPERKFAGRSMRSKPAGALDTSLAAAAAAAAS